MGGGSSREAAVEAKAPDGGHPKSPIQAGQWPYLHRHALVHFVGAYVMEDQINKAGEKLQELRQYCGMREGLDPASSLCLDHDEQEYHPNEQTECLIRHLTNLLSRQTDGWKHDFMQTVNKLSRDIGPPYYKSRAIPNVGEECLELMMTGKDLYNNSLEFTNLIKYIGSSFAKNVVKLDLGFTGIDDSNLTFMMPRIARMPRLAYLGLHGNRLTMSTVHKIIKLLQEKDLFVRIKWIDLSNNQDIFSLPPEFMALLKKRWERGSYRPSFHELVHNKIIVSTETGQFMHNI